jgi:hypothetical protein
LKFLDETGTLTPLQNLGASICVATIDIFGALPNADMLFEQSLISPDGIEKHKALADKIRKSGVQTIDDVERLKLLELALRFIPGKHKMVPMPDQLQDKILDARSRFREQISASAPGMYSFYRKTEYIDSHTILNNLFFGKLKTTDTKIQDKINEEIVQLLIEEDLLEAVGKIG